MQVKKNTKKPSSPKTGTRADSRYHPGCEYHKNDIHPSNTLTRFNGRFFLHSGLAFSHPSSGTSFSLGSSSLMCLCTQMGYDLLDPSTFSSCKLYCICWIIEILKPFVNDIPLVFCMEEMSPSMYEGHLQYSKDRDGHDHPKDSTHFAADDQGTHDEQRMHMEAFPDNQR